MSSLIDSDSRSAAAVRASPRQPEGDMHHCLRIQEIQTRIFRCLSENSCNVLARTCTAFYEEAMDIVWADVKTFIPLVKCIQPDILTIEVTNHPMIPSHETHTLTFSREPSPEDWKQFSKHARRVTVFKDGIIFASRKTYYRVSPEALTTISRFLNDEAMQNADYRLFPRLRALSVEGAISDRWVPKYLPYLSRDTLRTLNLRGSFETEDLNNDVHAGWSGVAPLMRSAWPRLQSIELDFRNVRDDSSELEGQHLEPRSQFLGPWFESLTHLRTLNASIALHPSLIPALSKLPLLRSLNLDLTVTLCESHLDKHHHTAIDAELLPLLRPCFSSLTVVDIGGDACALDSIIRLFQGLELSAKLRRINLSLYKIFNTPHLSTQFLALFEAISHIPSVTFLHIYLHRKGEGSNLVLSGTLLSKLFELRKLYTLHFQGDLDVTIEDKDLFNAAVAWPRLAEFEMPYHYSGEPYPLEQSRVTLVGVQALYEGCRLLRRVSVNIGCILPSVDHLIQAALPNLPPIQASDDTKDVSRKFTGESLNLNFVLPDPEASPDPFYYDMEHAQCMAMAIRVMLPKIDCLSYSCGANHSWTWYMAHFGCDYRRYIPEQAEVSALWEAMLKKRNVNAARQSRR